MARSHGNAKAHSTFYLVLILRAKLATDQPTMCVRELRQPDPAVPVEVSNSRIVRYVVVNTVTQLPGEFEEWEDRVAGGSVAHDGGVGDGLR